MLYLKGGKTVPRAARSARPPRLTLADGPSGLQCPAVVPGKEWDSWNRFWVRNQVWFRTRPEFCCRTRSTCLLNVAGQ